MSCDVKTNSKKYIMKIFLLTSTNTIKVTDAALRYYLKSVPSIDVSVITPSKKEILPCVSQSILSNINLIQDDEVEEYKVVKEWLSSQSQSIRRKNRAISWYLQQYLKLSLAWNSREPVFISDGDTIFATRILNEMSENPFLLKTKEIVHRYDQGQVAIGMPLANRSYIANGGYFEPSFLKSLSNNPEEWFINSLQQILALEGDGDFSEYQIMGTLLSENLIAKQLKLFRRFDLCVKGVNFLDNEQSLSKMSNALESYDAIAFEFGHNSSPLKRSMARIALKIGYSW